jgi:hypothetical protein
MGKTIGSGVQELQMLKQSREGNSMRRHDTAINPEIDPVHHKLQIRNGGYRSGVGR